MNEPLKRIRLKCRYEGDIRTVAITPESEFSELKKRLSADYNFDVSLKYEDKDGDFIILSSQHDLDDLFIFGESETVNVNVSETVLLPHLQLKGSSKSLSAVKSTMPPAKDWSRTSSSTSSHANMLRPIVTSSRVERFPNINDNSSPFRHESSNIRWKRAEMLGQGAFGVVYLGLNIDTGELMAVKQMATEEVSKRELSSLENEISLLRNLRHPNIVRYIGTELTQSALSIFLEYVPGGSLKALIDKFGRLEEAVAKSYTRQLLIGLEYLHRNGIAHRDIKGANCLVGNDGVIKLADFGNSKHWRASANGNSSSDLLHQTQQGTSSGDIKGTPSWMAPEIVRDQVGGISWKKADVWSLACTTLEMTTGKPPWSQFGNSVTVLYHLACQDTLPEYPQPASVELITFLNVCLQRDPAARPDITSLLLHSFVSANILPSGQNAAAAGGWGASYQQQQQQSGGHMFANRPSTVSSAVFSQWDSPHSGQAKATSNSAVRMPIGGTLQNVVSGTTPLGSPKGSQSQHRYSFSDSNATPLLQISPRATPTFQIGAFPTILSARDRSFRGDVNVGVGYDQTLPHRSLLSATSTPRLTVDSPHFGQHLQTTDNDPEMSHERPQSGRHASGMLSSRDRSYLSLEDSIVSKSLLEDEEEETATIAQSDPSTRVGIMPPIQITKPKIRDRTGKRSVGGKKSRKRQQSSVTSSVAADLTSDGEASVSSTPSAALIAGSRNRKAAASPLPISPAKKAPSTSQPVGKDTKQGIASGLTVVVPLLDMHIATSSSLVNQTTSRTALDWDDDSAVAAAELDGERKPSLDREKDEHSCAEDFVTCGEDDAGTVPSTTRLVITARYDDDLAVPFQPTAADFVISNEDLRFAQEGDADVLDTVQFAEKLVISCPNVYEEDPRSNTNVIAPEEQLNEPCLSPFLSQSVDGLGDSEQLLDASVSLLTPSTSSKAILETSLSIGHAPLIRMPSHRANATGLVTKSMDLSVPVRSGGNTSSRQQLHSRAVHLTDKDTTSDPLEMSCDSLEALQVLGLKPPRTAIDKDAPRSNAPTRRGAKRVSTADPQSGSEGHDEGKTDSSLLPGGTKESLEQRSLGEPQLLDEHSSWVTRLRAPQRTSLLVSASTDGTIRIWGPGETSSRAVLDTATFAQLMSKQTENTTASSANNERPEKKTTANAESETSISSSRTVKVLNAWAEDSCDTVWAACSDGALRVWSGAEGRPLRLLKGHDEPVTAMEGMDAGGVVSGGVQQSACLVSTGSADRTVRIWDVRAKKAQVFLFRGHGDTVLTLRWGDGGRSLISGGKDKTIRIWDTRAGRLRSTLEKHFGAVGAIRMFSGDNARVGTASANIGGSSNISFFSAGRDSVLNAWTANGDCVFSQTAHRGAATFLSEINYGRQQLGLGGPLMASLGADNIIKLWDLRRVRIASEIQSPSSAGNVSRAVWSGQSLVVSSSSGLVRQYDNVVSNVSSSMDNGGGGEWVGCDLASHGQASTDLIGTDCFLASSSRSGQILRWIYA